MAATFMAQEVGSLNGRCRRLKVLKSCSCGYFLFNLFVHFCCRMCHLATMYSVVDRQANGEKDRQADDHHHHANRESYGRLKTKNEK